MSHMMILVGMRYSQYAYHVESKHRQFDPQCHLQWTYDCNRDTQQGRVGKDIDNGDIGKDGSLLFLSL
jgi:hypothetical protein